MSSIGQALGGLVGGVIGFMVGGPTGAMYGAQIGITAGGLLDPPKVKGPRLDDLSFQTSTYGAVIPRVYGTIAQTGNVFWLQGNQITETSSTSSAKGGPEVTSYSYSATFAVGLCQGPIDGVLRIWVGSDLFYDAGSNDLDTIIASNQNAAGFTLYLGTNTQTADPLIQADKGVANVPAYRGLAYIVFDALPLEKYGNSLMGAQVKVEIVKDATYSADLIQTYVVAASSLWSTSQRCACNQHDSEGFRNYVAGNSAGDKTYWIREINGEEFASVLSQDGNVLSISTSLNDMHYAYAADNYQYIRWGSNGELYYYDCGSGYRCYAIGEGGGNVFFTWQANFGSTYYLKKPNREVSGTVTAGGIQMETDYTALLNTQVNYSCIAVWNGDAVVFNKLAGSTAYLLTIDIYSGDDATALSLLDSYTVTVTPSDSEGIDAQSASGHVYDDKLYIVYAMTTTTAKIIIVDLVAKALDGAYSVTSSMSGLATPSTPNVVAVGDLVFWGQRQSVDAFRSQVWKLEKITSGTTTLDQIVEAECLLSNLLSASDIDVTELTATVRGYRSSQQGAIRAALEPLRAAWPFDVVQHGYDIQFKMRGSASVATITADELDARAAGQNPGVQITDTREMDIQLPQKVSVKYLDSVREYDINEQSEERANTDAVNHLAIELPVVMNADEAKQTASTLLYLYWLERYDVSFSLPPTYHHLEPGDVITITADNATYELRLISVHYLADGRLECRAKYNDAAIYTQTSTGEEGQATGGTLTQSGPTALELLDIPLMRDDDDTAGFQVAMSGYMSGWPGGLLYRSEDGAQSWTDVAASVYPGAVIGVASNALSSHGGTVIDFSSTLSVKLFSGTLSSVTQAQLFAGSNWFAYGADGRWEIIAAMTATLQSDGSYVLRDFLRGQKGTEWATVQHDIDDHIVLLDEAVLNFVSVNSSSIGVEKLYRGITFGKPLDSAVNVAFSYDGVNLECLSPVHLSGDRHPSTNQWTLTWNRRSRYGDWRDYIDAPLGEASASYEIDIYSTSGYTTVVRTLTSTSETVNYSSAHQVTDFGSNQSTLYLKIYQLSATVGRGYPLTTSITRT